MAGIKVLSNQTVIYSVKEIADSLTKEISYVQEKHDNLAEGGSWVLTKFSRIYVRRGDGFEVWHTTRVSSLPLDAAKDERGFK